MVAGDPSLLLGGWQGLEWVDINLRRKLHKKRKHWNPMNWTLWELSRKTNEDLMEVGFADDVTFENEDSNLARFF